MNEPNETLENTVKELERYFAGRLARAVEVKYGSIHLQLVDDLSSEDVDAVYQALGTDSKPVRRWRVRQVNNLLLLSVDTTGSEWA